MQLATAELARRDCFPVGSATVVEWGNQRFRYSEQWLSECEKISGRTSIIIQNSLIMLQITAQVNIYLISAQCLKTCIICVKQAVL